MPTVGLDTTEFFFRKLLLARVQLSWLHTELYRQWDSNRHTFFRRLGLARVQMSWLPKEICRLLDSKQRSFSPMATVSTLSTE